MKYMNMKRFASVAMAGAIAVSMMAPAFAEDPSTVIEGAYAEQEIAVTVPDSGSAIINPYGLPVDLMDNRGKNVLATISEEQITTAAPLMISNQSSVGMEVTVNGKIEVPTGSGITIITTGSPAAANKDALVNFEMFAINELLDETDEETVATKFAALKTSDADVSLNLATTAADAASTIILREGDADGATQAGGQAFVRLAGQVTKAPTTAGKEWKETDTFTATIIYKFEPKAYPAKSAGSISGTTTIAASGSQDLTLAPALPSGVTVSTWTWTSSNNTVASVVPKTGVTTGLVATVTNESTGAATITVSGIGSDGLPYSATASVTCS